MEERKILYVVLSVALLLFVVLMGVMLYNKTIEPEKQNHIANVNTLGNNYDQLSKKPDLENELPTEETYSESDNEDENVNRKNEDSSDLYESEGAEEFENYMTGTDENLEPPEGKNTRSTPDENLPPPKATDSNKKKTSKESNSRNLPAKTNDVKRNETPPVSYSVPKVPKKVWVNEYWIQAASFKNKYKAEQIKIKLSDNNVASRIIPKQINNEDYYRVRIGPYNNKYEAEKFLLWVHSINGFSESYISLVPVRK